MELSAYFKSIIEQDSCPVVICDLEHTILYLNPAACKRYEKAGGSAMVGRSLLGCHNANSNQKIMMVLEWFEKNADNNRIYIDYNPAENKDVYMVALRDENRNLIGYYEKHEYRNRETVSLYDFK